MNQDGKKLRERSMSTKEAIDVEKGSRATSTRPAQKNLGDRSTSMGFNPDALREKYRHERDRRLRPDGENQYLEVKGEFGHFADVDPWADEIIPREPLNDEVEVVVVGGGFSGMLAAVRLREAGVDDMRIVEAGNDFGGTWYWNRYPGCQCDFESYCYLPLLEETGYIPKEKYAFAEEIFDHCRRVANHYRLYDAACFQTRVTELRWDEESRRWIVSTNRSDRIRARFVIVGPGPTGRPKLAGIPGIEQFEGHSFHTSRWDYDYTGGDRHGNLHRLADKRVAIIGTGATAIQCVPYLGAHAEHLYVFQRTPSVVDYRGNKPTDPDWAESLTPGWQRRRRQNFTQVMRGEEVEEDLVNDGWTSIYRSLKVMETRGTKKVAEGVDPTLVGEIADFEKMEQIRARIDATVKDSQTAEMLKPWYRMMCKRPCFNDEYLETFNRPNVTLVDVSTSRGVECITTKGVVAGGIEYPVDCIVYSTGFEIGTSPRRRFNYDILGENGQSLFDHWAGGVRTLHGHSSRGFPNWFFIGLGQSARSPNFTAIVDDQAQHIAYIITEVRRRGATTVQPTAEGEQAWVDEIQAQSAINAVFWESCTPSYYNNEGRFREVTTSFFGDAYSPGLNAFNALLAAWRDAGSLEGLELQGPTK